MHEANKKGNLISPNSRDSTLAGRVRERERECDLLFTRRTFFGNTRGGMRHTFSPFFRGSSRGIFDAYIIMLQSLCSFNVVVAGISSRGQKRLVRCLLRWFKNSSKYILGLCLSRYDWYVYVRFETKQTMLVLLLRII